MRTIGGVLIALGGAKLIAVVRYAGEGLHASEVASLVGAVLIVWGVVVVAGGRKKPGEGG